MNMKLELLIIPVTDVDRAKDFYVDKVGFNADHDHTVSEEVRFVQLTPPGSACSIAFGKGLTDAEPGSVKGIQAVIENAAEAREELAGRGVEVSEVDEQAWGKFVYFSDPDGNAWALQQIVIPDLGLSRRLLRVALVAVLLLALHREVRGESAQGTEWEDCPGDASEQLDVAELVEQVRGLAALALAQVLRRATVGLPREREQA